MEENQHHVAVNIDSIYDTMYYTTLDQSECEADNESTLFK